ncbi:TPM domain-containing protein [bacterium]|nr:TPM domain-containing protein [bacterium]
MHIARLSHYCMILLLALLAVPVLGGRIPDPGPQVGTVYDYADVLDADTEARVEEVQHQALEKYNTPIVVVTIPSIADYGFEDETIEYVSHRWIRDWNIGTLNRPDEPSNGILGDVGVMESVGGDFIVNTRDDVLSAINSSQSADQLASAILDAAKTLSKQLPHKDGHSDRLPNQLVIIHPRP